MNRLVINDLMNMTILCRIPLYLYRMSMLTLCLFLMGYPVFLWAQVPTTNKGQSNKTQTVTITTSFKPTLRAVSKLNFITAVPSNTPIDKVELKYDVPQQNLFFSFKPIGVKPLALLSNLPIFPRDHYLKLGFGNYLTPYAELGITLGNMKKTSIQLYTDYLSSNGKALNQQYTKAQANVKGNFILSKNRLNLETSIFYNYSQQYKYGFQPDGLRFSKDGLRQTFNTFGFNIGLSNLNYNRFKVNYHPSFEFRYFKDNNKGSEAKFTVSYPFSIPIWRTIGFDFNRYADLTIFKSPVASIYNYLVSLRPGFTYLHPKVDVLIAPNITINNKGAKLNTAEVTVLPIVAVKAKVIQNYIVAEAGWKGYYTKIDYQYLASINPWLAQPTFLNNTRNIEEYFGLSGALFNHLTYHTTFNFIQTRNYSVFINDTTAGSGGKSFNIVNINKMNIFKIHTEFAYNVRDKFHAVVGMNYSKFYGLSNGLQPWGLLPVDFEANLNWKILRGFYAKMDFFVWQGALYQQAKNNTYTTARLGAAADMNIGLSYQIIKNLGVWVQLNNIFNNQYQRWNQYTVLGFNVLGGLKISLTK
ncbi:MAG: hypothetical protein QM528_03450 [Phycisphaerales bacterium]|nr:hypothetical protein [Phycisphaerales bacterium]